MHTNSSSSCFWVSLVYVFVDLVELSRTLVKGIYGAYFSKLNYSWSRDVRSNRWFKKHPVLEVVLVSRKVNPLHWSLTMPGYSCYCDFLFSEPVCSYGWDGTCLHSLLRMPHGWCRQSLRFVCSEPGRLGTSLASCPSDCSGYAHEKRTDNHYIRHQASRGYLHPNAWCRCLCWTYPRHRCSTSTMALSEQSCLFCLQWRQGLRCAWPLCHGRCCCCVIWRHGLRFSMFNLSRE